MSQPVSLDGLIIGRRYVVTWTATDPGAGPERGTGVYAYRGRTTWGKVRLAAVDGTILQLPPADITSARTP
jgi:hypothetical protein